MIRARIEKINGESVIIWAPRTPDEANPPAQRRQGHRSFANSAARTSVATAPPAEANRLAPPAPDAAIHELIAGLAEHAQAMRALTARLDTTPISTAAAPGLSVPPAVAAHRFADDDDAARFARAALARKPRKRTKKN